MQSRRFHSFKSSSLCAQLLISRSRTRHSRYNIIGAKTALRYIRDIQREIYMRIALYDAHSRRERESFAWTNAFTASCPHVGRRLAAQAPRESIPLQLYTPGFSSENYNTRRATILLCPALRFFFLRTCRNYAV